MNKRPRSLKAKAQQEVPTLKTSEDGTRRWTLNGDRHRIDGPAVEYADGTKMWYVKDKRHRIDGPAIEDADGTKERYVNGQPHRTDGPAVENADGTKMWWINGWSIFATYSHVLTAACARGLPIPEEAMMEMVKIWPEAQGDEQITRLNSILHKHWPMDVRQILATLFSDSDPDIKHLAFSLLGREVLPDSTLSVIL